MLTPNKNFVDAIRKYINRSYDLEELNVDSAAIASFVYDAETKQVDVTFQDGSSYTYHAVTQRKFDNWTNSGSIGGYFNEKIKNKYVYNRNH